MSCHKISNTDTPLKSSVAKFIAPSVDIKELKIEFSNHILYSRTAQPVQEAGSIHSNLGDSGSSMRLLPVNFISFFRFL